MVTAALILAVLALAMPAGARERSVAPRIVALGDSLTSGHGIGASQAFPAVVQGRLQRAGLNYTVVNAGISRQTSNGAVRRLDETLRGDARGPIGALGANDGLQGRRVAGHEPHL